MFQLSQLRCFVTVADELHFGRAAERLNMTQPPLSRQIQLLERVVGVPLLERTSRSVRLTHAGRDFVREARRILKLADSAMLSARNIARGEAGRLSLGFTAASGYRLLPQLLTSAKIELPNIQLTLREMVSDEQVEALIDGRIDIALLRPPITRPDFVSWLMVTEPLVAALPVGDDRLEKDVLELSDFHGRQFIMYSPDGAGYFHNMVVSLLSSQKVFPIHVQYMSQIHSMLSLVRAGLGAAIVPAAARSFHPEDLDFRPIMTDPAEPVELYMAWLDSNRNPSLERFVEMSSQAVSPFPAQEGDPYK